MPMPTPDEMSAGIKGELHAQEAKVALDRAVHHLVRVPVIFHEGADAELKSEAARLRARVEKVLERAEEFARERDIA